MKYIIEKDEIIYDEFYRVRRAYLKHDLFDGRVSDTVRRYSFEKNNGVAAMVYHLDRKRILLVKQFRFPPITHGHTGWITEMVAGGIDPNEDPDDAIQREIIEEVGYAALTFELIQDCYVSPGIFSEKMKLYYAEISEESKVDEGGGLADEGEDIQLVWLTLPETREWLDAGKFEDAKTIIGAYYVLNKWGGDDGFGVLQV